MSSRRSCGGPGRFSSGLWDIQHRAMGTLKITASRCQGEDVEERGTQLGGELSDARARDTAIGAQEQHRFLVRVEPGLKTTGAIADDHNVGVVVPGPMQLSERAERNKAAAQGFPRRESVIAEDFARVVVPTQHREPADQDLVQEDILLRSGINPGLNEQRADRRAGIARLVRIQRVNHGPVLVARHRLEPHFQHIPLERRHN